MAVACGRSPRSARRPVGPSLQLAFVRHDAGTARRPRPLEVPPTPRRIDPQTADARSLESLPGVGPAIARRIVAARARGLTFRRPEDLLRVRGIGPATLRRMRDALDFGGAPTGRSATTRPP